MNLGLFQEFEVPLLLLHFALDSEFFHHEFLHQFNPIFLVPDCLEDGLENLSLGYLRQETRFETVEVAVHLGNWQRGKLTSEGAEGKRLGRLLVERWIHVELVVWFAHLECLQLFCDYQTRLFLHFPVEFRARDFNGLSLVICTLQSSSIAHSQRLTQTQKSTTLTLSHRRFAKEQ